MNYTKNGDFSALQQSIDGSVNQIVIYKHTNTTITPIISELTLSGFPNGDLQLLAFAPTEEKYQLLKQAIVAAGFPEPDFIDLESKHVSITSSQLPILSNFVQALYGVDSQFNEVAEQLRTTLNLDLSRVHEMNLPQNPRPLASTNVMQGFLDYSLFASNSGRFFIM